MCLKNKCFLISASPLRSVVVIVLLPLLFLSPSSQSRSKGRELSSLFWLARAIGDGGSGGGRASLLAARRVFGCSIEKSIEKLN